MSALPLILVVVAVACFVLAGLGVPKGGRLNLMAFGLGAWCWLSYLLLR